MLEVVTFLQKGSCVQQGQECQDLHPGTAAKTQQQDEADFQCGSKRRKKTVWEGHKNWGREEKNLCLVPPVSRSCLDWSSWSEFLLLVLDRLCSEEGKEAVISKMGPKFLCCRNPKKC